MNSAEGPQIMGAHPNVAHACQSIDGAHPLFHCLVAHTLYTGMGASTPLVL